MLLAQGEIETKRATCRRIPHVTTLAPKERALGSRRHRAAIGNVFSTHCRTNKNTRLRPHQYFRQAFGLVVQSISVKPASSHRIYLATIANRIHLIPYALYKQRRPEAKRFSVDGSLGSLQGGRRTQEVQITFDLSSMPPIPSLLKPINCKLVAKRK